MLLKISARNHFLAIRNHLIPLILFVLSMAFLPKQWYGPILVCYLLFGISFMTALYLHVQYYLVNKDVQIEIVGNGFRLIRRQKSTFNSVSEIKALKVAKAISMITRGVPLWGLRNYCYVQVLLTDDSSFCLTCLLAPNIDDLLLMLFPNIPSYQFRTAWPDIHTRMNERPVTENQDTSFYE